MVVSNGAFIFEANVLLGLRLLCFFFGRLTATFQVKWPCVNNMSKFCLNLILRGDIYII